MVLQFILLVLENAKALTLDHLLEALPWGRHPKKAGRHSMKTTRNRQEKPL
jgi:hypothetical protein